MTQRPPPRIAGGRSGPPDPDPARDEYLNAFLHAVIAHHRAVRDERRRFAAEIAGLRERYRRPAGTGPRETPDHQPRWHQAALDEIRNEQE